MRAEFLHANAQLRDNQAALARVHKVQLEDVGHRPRDALAEYAVDRARAVSVEVVLLRRLRRLPCVRWWMCWYVYFIAQALSPGCSSKRFGIAEHAAALPKSLPQPAIAQL